MKVALTIPDELYEKYLALADGDGRRVAPILRQRLETYQDANPATRPIILTSEHRRALEEILSSTIDSPEAIIDLCQRLSRIELGEILCDFTIDELEQMKNQANFMGETMEEYLTRHSNDFRLYIIGIS